MSDRLSALPDDILCHMLSFLTLKDSIKTRFLSDRWRYLVDDRSVIDIQLHNVFGCEYLSLESGRVPKFVRPVDQALELRKGRNHSALKLNFFVHDLQASDVDRWVESGIKMRIETLELCLPPIIDGLYVIPDQLFQSYHSRKAFYLKSLLLIHCALTLSSECRNWLSHLTTLRLMNVPLQQKDIECVVSGALNLTSLRLHNCGKTDDYLPIIVQLPRLKDLIVYKSKCFKQVELNFPNLESFICVGQEAMDLKFSYMPLLKKVDLRNTFHSSNSSLMFDELARHTPKLNELSLYLLTEVQPFPASNTLWCLKRLDLNIRGFERFTEIVFDILTITYLLNASPFLETLHLNIWSCNNEQNGVQVQQREYLDDPHLHLKEVKMEGFKRTRNEMEFARYLLKNVVALERMILEDDCYYSAAREVTGTSSSFSTNCRLPGIKEKIATCCSLKREEMAKALLKDLETNAELVCRRGSNVLLIASNRVGYGVHLFRPDPNIV